MSTVRDVDAKRLLRMLSILGVFVGAGVAYVVFQLVPAFTLLPVGLSVGCLIYALIGGMNLRGSEWLDRLPRAEPHLPGILTSLFFLASAGSILVLSTAYYTKPLAYYLLIAVTVAAIGLRIVFTQAHRTNAVLAGLLGLNTYVSNQLAFPLGLNGPDIGAHLGFTRVILETGFIAETGVYSGFPGQHVLAATAVLLSGGDLTLTYRFVGIAGMLLGLPVAYLLAQRFVHRRYAALAVVVYATMDYVVYRAGHPSKLAYALPLFLLLFTFVVYLDEKRTPGRYILFTLFALALIFTHHHTAFVALLMLGAIAVVLRLVTEIDRRDPFGTRGPPPLEVSRDGETTARIGSRGHVIALLFAVAFLTQFIYWSGFFGQLVSVAQTYVDVLFQVGGEETTKETGRFAVIPLRTLLINTIGTGLLVTLTVVGGLGFIREWWRLGSVVLGWLAVAGALMVGGVLFNVPFALPQRVFVMAQLTGMGLFAMAGLVYLLRLAELRESEITRSSIALIVVVVLVSFSFFSAASTVAGIETSPFNEDVGHRTWYGMEEEQASDLFLASSGINTSSFQWARGMPVSKTGEVAYAALDNGDVYGRNQHRMNSGVVVSGGKGRIGTGQYVFPEASPREGDTRLYDNGIIDIQIKSFENGQGDK